MEGMLSQYRVLDLTDHRGAVNRQPKSPYNYVRESLSATLDSENIDMSS